MTAFTTSTTVQARTSRTTWVPAQLIAAIGPDGTRTRAAHLDVRAALADTQDGTRFLVRLADGVTARAHPSKVRPV